MEVRMLILVIAFAATFLVGCRSFAAPSATSSPVVWHEGEDFVQAPTGIDMAVGDKALASGGRALYGSVLARKGNAAAYELALPRAVNDARIVFRYARLHWRSMPPSQVALELRQGDKVVQGKVTFTDTKGWGEKPQDWRIAVVEVGDLSAGTYSLRLTSLADESDINLDGFFVVPGGFAISAEEMALTRIRITSEGYCGYKGDLAIRQDLVREVPVAARRFDGSQPQVSAAMGQGKGRAALEPARKPEAGADAAWSFAFSLPELADGDYTLHISCDNVASHVELPVLLLGQFMASLESRLGALKSYTTRLEKSPNAERCLADFLHAVEWLEQNREAVLKSQTPGPAAGGMRRVLPQSEETMRRLEAGQDPYAGRSGDLRRAFRSAATGKLEPYRVYVPQAYEKADRVPFILMLHGGGGTEDTFPDLQGGVLLPMLEQAGYLMVSPRCTSWYAGDGQRDLVQLIELVRKEYPKIDPSRMYCTGVSRGGFGTYSLATAYPDLFAAICCVSGTGDAQGAKALKDVPLLILQGGADTVVPPEGARKAAARMEELRYTVELHVFPTYTHDYHGAEYMKLTLDFFNQHHKSGPQTR